MELVPLDGNPNEIYNEEQMKQQFGLDSNKKIADYYFHYPHCTWAVQECKSSYRISIGIKQLESTIEQLLEKEKRVDYAIITMKKYSKETKYLYDIDKNTHELLFKSNKKVIKICGIKVLLYLRNEVREMHKQLRLG